MAVSVGATRVGGRAPRWLTRRSQWGTAFVLLLPALALFLVFTAYPFFYALRLSFFRWDGLSQHQQYVGLGNYRALAHDHEFVHSLKVTAIYTVATTTYVARELKEKLGRIDTRRLGPMLRDLTVNYLRSHGFMKG